MMKIQSKIITVIFKYDKSIDVHEEPGGNRIGTMKIKAQQKIRKTGIFVPKGLFRFDVSLLDVPLKIMLPRKH